MKKIFMSIGIGIFTTFAMADFVLVIHQNHANYSTGVIGEPEEKVNPNNPNTIFCEAGTGLTRSELIALIDSKADVTNVCTSDITDFSDLLNKYRTGVTDENYIRYFNQNIGNWDVSNGTNFDRFLNSNYGFNQDLSGWNVSSKATSMYRMFWDASKFNSNLNNWDVSNVENFEEMFMSAVLFNGDISSWNPKSVTNFTRMFYYAYDFNQPIGNWDVSKGDLFTNMFYNAKDFNNNILGWDVENATNWTNFRYASPLSDSNTPSKFL